MNSEQMDLAEKTFDKWMRLTGGNQAVAKEKAHQAVERAEISSK